MKTNYLYLFTFPWRLRDRLFPCTLDTWPWSATQLYFHSPQILSCQYWIQILQLGAAFPKMPFCQVEVSSIPQGTDYLYMEDSCPSLFAEVVFKPQGKAETSDLLRFLLAVFSLYIVPCFLRATGSRVPCSCQSQKMLKSLSLNCRVFAYKPPTSYYIL